MANSPGKRTRTRNPHALGLVLAFLLCFGLYFLFLGQFSLQELVLATVCSALCSAFASLLFRGAPKVRFRLGDVVQGWRVPGYVLEQVPQITWLLIQDFAGRRAGSLFVESRFEGDPHSADDGGRRVLAVAYTSTSPNSIVLEIDPHQQCMRYHQVLPAELGKMTERLGARP